VWKAPALDNVRAGSSLPFIAFPKRLASPKLAKRSAVSLFTDEKEASMTALS
jgi:hypothetical protein